jgi:beta-lysine N6-acetyltransferase
MLDESDDTDSNLIQPNGYKVKQLKPEHSEEMVAIYREVFDSYPFPIHDKKYIEDTMQDEVQYYGVEENGKLLALASSEMDKKGLNAEMTDFATPKENRGKKLSLLLLQEMERQMEKQGFKTLYTMSRLNSVGMNKTFLRSGYVYSGTTINNTNIAGKIESLNIFYKHI